MTNETKKKPRKDRKTLSA